MVLAVLMQTYSYSAAVQQQLALEPHSVKAYVSDTPLYHINIKILTSRRLQLLTHYSWRRTLLLQQLLVLLAAKAKQQQQQQQEAAAAAALRLTEQAGAQPAQHQ
jgi:hypothetical protein